VEEQRMHLLEEKLSNGTLSPEEAEELKRVEHDRMLNLEYEVAHGAAMSDRQKRELQILEEKRLDELVQRMENGELTEEEMAELTKLEEATQDRMHTLEREAAQHRLAKAEAAELHMLHHDQLAYLLQLQKQGRVLTPAQLEELARLEAEETETELRRLEAMKSARDSAFVASHFNFVLTAQDGEVFYGAMEPATTIQQFLDRAEEMEQECRSRDRMYTLQQGGLIRVVSHNCMSFDGVLAFPAQPLSASGMQPGEEYIRVTANVGKRFQASS